MKERPILFSAPMVRADLEDRKTMTRRVVKPYRKHPIVNLAEAEPTLGYSGLHNDPDSWGYEFLDDGAPASLSSWPELCPYGQPGDRLWVREAWRTLDYLDEHSGARVAELCLDAGYRRPLAPIEYIVDGERMNWEHTSTPPHRGQPEPGRYRHARFMPRWASRLTLEVTSVRVERLQDISEADAIAEGLLRDRDGWRGAPDLPWFASPVAAYRSLWESINGADSWNANPWVWVVEFKRLEQSHV